MDMVQTPTLCCTQPALDALRLKYSTTRRPVFADINFKPVDAARCILTAVEQ